MTPARPPPHSAFNARVQLLAALALLVLTATVCGVRAWRMRYDFHHFYLDGAYVWAHGALNPDIGDPAEPGNRQLGFYLPAVPILLAPLTAGGPRGAAVLWTALQVVAVGVCLHRLWAWPVRADASRTADDDAGRTAILAAALALPVVYEAARFNQLSFMVLAALLLGVAALHRGRDTQAGAWFAAAAVVKLLPALFLPWLLLKRRWRAAGAMVAVGLLLALLPPLAVLGPAGTIAEHRHWADTNISGVLGSGVESAGAQPHFGDHRNQSIRSVTRRALQAATGTPQHAGPLAAGIALALLAAAGIALRRPATALPAPALDCEAALVLLTMLSLSPLVRTYYLVWATPALLLLLADRRSAVRWTATGVWVAAMAAWPIEAARLWGVHLCLLLTLAGLLVGTGVPPVRRVAPPSRP